MAGRDIDAKAKEIVFLKDRGSPLEMQVSILRKHLHRKGQSPRYTVHEKPESRPIPASYPNHVWSVDTTQVWCWGLWPLEVLVAIDHFSRKLVCVAPLEGPNAGWIIEALEQALRKHGAPKHIISDPASVFTGHAFAERLRQQQFSPRGRTQASNPLPPAPPRSHTSPLL